MQSLIEIKKEYIEHIQDILTIPIAERIYAIYIESNKNKNGLKIFQNNLNIIKDWNNYIVEEETKKIIDKTKINYLQKLLKITIITSIKIYLYEYKKNLNETHVFNTNTDF